MAPTLPEDVLGATIDALSISGDDALTKASVEGLPDRTEVAVWIERTKLLIQTQREPSALRSEVPWLAQRLLGPFEDLLRLLWEPAGVDQQ